MPGNDQWPNWDLAFTDDVFGPLLMGGSVEQAMIKTLKLWLPSYIFEINRQLGASVLSVPQDYLYQPTERTIAAGVAQVMVAVPGTATTPERHTNGTRATFDARASVFYGGDQDYNKARAIGNSYVAAVVGCIVQHPSLGGFASMTRWVGYKMGTEGRSAGAWRMAITASFHVVVDNVLNPFGGPPEPRIATPADLPVVSAENVQVTQE